MPARTGLAFGALVLAAASLSACAGSAPSLALAPAALPAPPPGPPSPPVPAVKPASFTQIGTASWYGRAFHHKPTASGEPYDMHALTAAHRSLPLDTLVRVTNLDNGRSVVVRINDRGPYEPGRVIDLSAKAARVLRMKRAGLARVRIDLYHPQVATGDAS
jgi:rare lipoprotein A